MASSIPSQLRAVDPFASYNSNTVNKLTRMVTYGDDGLANAVSCDVLLDSTSNTQVVLHPGQIYKDDVFIDIERHTIDFTDSDHYYNFDTGFDMAGYYYIVLEYTYQKSRPAPQAKILIVKPNQRTAYIPGRSWFFLKAVKVIGVGPFFIDSVYDFDPENPGNKREYAKYYAGTDVTLQTFNPGRDRGRVEYSIEDDNFFFGLKDRWASLSGSGIFKCDTRGFTTGDLIYIKHDGKPDLAKPINGYFFSDGVVKTIGEYGIVYTTGEIGDVKVETGDNIIPGTLLYLSKNEPGKVTSEPTFPIEQFVGRCVEVINTETIRIVYHRGEPNNTYGDIVTPACVLLNANLSPTSWNNSAGLFFQDVDITNVTKKNAVFTIWDAETELKFNPSDIEFLDNTTARIWVEDSTRDLNVFILGSGQSCDSTSTLVINEILEPGIPPWQIWDPTEEAEKNWGPSFNGAEWGDSTSSTIWGGIGEYPPDIDTTSIIYYQSIDISSITGKECAVLIRDTSTHRQIRSRYVVFENSSVLKILTDDTSTEIEVILVGPGFSTHPTLSYTTILKEGFPYWKHSDVAGNPTEADWGPTTIDAEWGPSPTSTIWSGPGTSSSYDGLFFQDIDISFFNNNFIVMETYDRATNKVIYPTYTQFIGIDTIRIWMENIYHSLNVTIIGNTEPYDDSTSPVIITYADTLTPVILPAGASWNSFAGSYYQDVDISGLEGDDVIITVWNKTTEMYIQPEDIEIISDTTARIWEPINTDTLQVFVMGTAIGTPVNNTTKVNSTLLAGGSWNSSLGLYYQDIDVSNIIIPDSAVLVKDSITKEVMLPEEIQIDSTSNLRIWMTGFTDTLEVTAAGPSTSGNLMIQVNTLPTSNWFFSGGQYYQDIDIEDLGEDVVIQVYDISTNKVIEPETVDFISSSVLRIWMTNNTTQLKVIIIG